MGRSGSVFLKLETESFDSSVDIAMYMLPIDYFDGVDYVDDRKCKRQEESAISAMRLSFFLTLPVFSLLIKLCASSSKRSGQYRLCVWSH
jgi:hypothetical protein